MIRRPFCYLPRTVTRTRAATAASTASFCLFLLAGCGGSMNASNPVSMGPPPRGTLLAAPSLIADVPSPSLLAELSSTANQQILALGGVPVCDVLSFRIEYETVGGLGEATSASAALMVPTGVGPHCSGKRPILLYAHGTTTDRTFDIADLNDNSNAEGLLLAAFFATQGYVVVAPNYAGYDTSKLTYHPYLVADQQSKDMIDALAAARTALPLSSALQTADSGQLFVTGYSQGGYVAMATLRALELGKLPVTAAAPMSGPYALAAFVDAVFSGQVTLDAPTVTTFLMTAYQHVYGNVYSNPASVFEAQYATGIDSLLPSTTPRSQLYAEGKLPEHALFSATPPNPSYADITPATMPADLAPEFALGFGADDLITNGYRLSYLLDAQARPDGGWPTVTTGLPASSPGIGLREDLKTNDLRGWVPATPILLCGGDADPTVFWLNTQLVQDYWKTHPPAKGSTVLDVDSATIANDPYSSLKTGFAAAKGIVAAAAVAQGATDGGAMAVSQAYHSSLVPPFCLVAVRSFFADRTS
jgi:predicted esterase